MAATAEGRRLTEAHRRAQIQLRTILTARLQQAQQVLDPRRLDRTTGPWLAVVQDIIGTLRQESAQRSTTYYRSFRAAEAPRAPLPRMRLAEPANPVAVRTSLLVTGPSTIKRQTVAGVAPYRAVGTATVRVAAAATRHVLGGGRDAIVEAIASDPIALGWSRVTDGDPCWFCAMQASRGPVYESKRSALYTDEGLRYHDGCGCTTEPVYNLDMAWPGNGREWEQLWRRTTRGLSADEARKAFRRAVDAKRRGEDPVTAAQPPKKAGTRRRQPAADPTPAPTRTDFKRGQLEAFEESVAAMERLQARGEDFSTALADRRRQIARLRAELAA